MPSKAKTDEIDDIVDDLEGLEDEDVEIEDDPDEKPKRSRKGKGKAAKEKKEKVGIGTKEVAEALGTTGRELRMFLRASSYQPKDSREGRYNWTGLNDPEVKQIMKEFKAGAAEKANKAANAEAKGKTSSKKKARAAVEEDEDDDE